MTALSGPASALFIPPLNEVNMQALTYFGFLGPIAVTNSGGTVKFVNHEFLGDIPHTATATDGSFDSGFLPVHGEFVAVINAPAGSVIAYSCLLHPNMVGAILVK